MIHVFYRLGHEKVTKRILAGEFIIVALSVAVGFVIRQTIGNPVLQAFCQGYSHDFYEYLARYKGMYVSMQEIINQMITLNSLINEHIGLAFSNYFSFNKRIRFPPYILIFHIRNKKNIFSPCSLIPVCLFISLSQPRCSIF